MSLKSFLEFSLGLGYILGKSVFEIILFITTSIWSFMTSTFSLLQVLSYAFVDVVAEIIKGVLLVYYGIGKTIEGFQNTTYDLINSIDKSYKSLSELTSTTFEGLIKSISAFSLVPQQLVSALDIVGITTYGYLCAIWNLIYAFIVQVIYSPIRIVQISKQFIIYMLMKQYNFLINIPVTAYIGLLVIFLIYFIYCKMSMRTVVRSLWFGLRRSSIILFYIIRTICILAPNVLFFRRQRIREIIEEQDNLNPFQGATSKNGSKGICVICQDSQVSFISSPCNHVSLCSDCVHEIVERDSRCPVCRSEVQHYARVYIP